MSMMESLRMLVVLGVLGAGAACSPTPGPAPAPSGAAQTGAPDPSATPTPTPPTTEPTPAAPATPACGTADPAKRYVGRSPDECARIRFVCNAGEEYFSDDCGCGCKKTGAAPSP